MNRMNLSNNSIIVQKYGGTSVGSVERIKSVAERVVRVHKSGQKKIAVVVSAMAGETNRLVELVGQVNPNAPHESYDMAVSAGEQVSVALMASAIAGLGVGSKPLLAYQLGIRTTEIHSRARIQKIDCDLIRRVWQDDQIPVIAGFQGVSENMQLTTLGRGGSDTSAVALAVALKADLCEINTDVDGIYTADPRIVPEARLMPFVDVNLAMELAFLGSKVLHPRCVELAAKFRMPLVVRNSFSPDDSPRSIIMSNPPEEILEAAVVSGVTTDRKIAKFTVKGLPDDPAAIAEIFGRLAEDEVNIDVIVHDRAGDSGAMNLGFTTEATDTESVAKSIHSLSTAKKWNVTLETEADLAKVSVVGVGMQTYPGVAGKTFQTLADNNIPIKMISTSEIKISVVVSGDQADLATRSLHESFLRN